MLRSAKNALLVSALLSVLGAGLIASPSAAQPNDAALRSCPSGMIPIPAGAFQMGEAPAHHVDLAAYCIDRLPVTNTQYKQFIDSAKYHPPESILIKSSGFPEPDLWRGADYPREIASQPVVNVSWI